VSEPNLGPVRPVVLGRLISLGGGRLCRKVLSGPRRATPCLNLIYTKLAQINLPNSTRVEDHMIELASAFFTILLFACIPLSGWIAERRGRSIKLWCWMGFVFGPIAPLVVALLPPAPPSGPPASGPPPSRSGPWRRTHGRASGERGADDSRIIVVCATP
jgi:MFS family permease